MEDKKPAPELEPKLKLYGTSISPVCRAVMWLLEAEHIPHEKKTMNLVKGKRRHYLIANCILAFSAAVLAFSAASEHLGNTPLAQELAKINPNRQVPAIDDGGFCLFES